MGENMTASAMVDSQSDYRQIPLFSGSGSINIYLVKIRANTSIE